MKLRNLTLVIIILLIFQYTQTNFTFDIKPKLVVVGIATGLLTYELLNKIQDNILVSIKNINPEYKNWICRKNKVYINLLNQRLKNLNFLNKFFYRMIFSIYNNSIVDIDGNKPDKYLEWENQENYLKLMKMCRIAVSLIFSYLSYNYLIMKSTKI